MITDDEIKNQPDDPKLAFANYVSLLRKVVAENAIEENDNIEREYVANVKAFAEFCQIDLEVQVEPGPDFWDNYRHLNDRLNYLMAKFRIEGLRNNSSQTVCKN